MNLTQPRQIAGASARRYRGALVGRTITACPTWAAVAIAIGVAVFGATVSPATQAAEQDSAGADATLRCIKTSGIQFCTRDGSAGLCDVYLPAPQASDLAPEQTGPATEDDANTNAATPSPNGRVDRRWPVVLVVHGGGWAAGDKWTMNGHCQALAKSGVAAVSINYRLAPEFQFPAQVDDLREALVWITRHAQEYSLDLDRVGLFGYSAGGHLVSLLGTLADEPWETVQNTTTWPQADSRWDEIPTIRAVCAGGPPTNFQNLPPGNSALAYFLGGTRQEVPEVYSAASPLHHASNGDPPFQLVHGEADGIVPVEGSQAFHQGLTEVGVNASLKVLPKNGHLLAFINPQMTEAMVRFFVQQLDVDKQDAQTPAADN
ncbi:alpha/beta hydrolase [Roseiconus nitratireducens]|nr:alpha/beta hydrolase [Roseiconus nitratireducens]